MAICTSGTNGLFIFGQIKVKNIRYIIILPAYNEEDYLPRTLAALAKQELLPKQLIIVNDGSTDRTGDMAEAFAAAHEWAKVVHSGEDKGYHGGSKIVAAFYRGFNAIDVEYDLVGKLDADIELVPEYYQTLAGHFAREERLGLAGGVMLTEKDGDWIYENISDRDHVKGAYKTWRKEAFESIGGIRSTIGWDTADELLIQYREWTVKVDEELPIKHYRPLGTNTGFFKIRIRIGYSLYRLRYGFWVSFLSSLKVCFRNKPYILSGLAMMYGFLQAAWRGDDYAVTEEEGQFIREFRWARILQKVKGKSTS